jgi:hypothetical protein
LLGAKLLFNNQTEKIMIYLNDEVQKLDSKDCEIYEEYRKAMEFFEGIGFPLRFTVKDSYVTKEVDDQGHVHFTFPANTIPHSATELDAYGSKKWVYSRIPPRKDTNGNWRWNEPWERLTKKSFSLDRDQADKAFFLWFKSKPFQNLYNLEDNKKAASEDLEAKVNALKLEQAFYSESSILLNDEARLRTLARAYSIPNVESLTKAQVLQALKANVEALINNGKKTLDEFLESITLDADTELLASIQKAKDEGYILADDKVCKWFFVNPDGNIGDTIMNVPRNNWYRHTEVLKDFLLTNEDMLKRFKSYIQEDSPDDLDIDLDNLEHLDWEVVVAFANQNGINGTGRGRNKQVVMKEIREKFGK